MNNENYVCLYGIHPIHHFSMVRAEQSHSYAVHDLHLPSFVLVDCFSHIIAKKPSIYPKPKLSPIMRVRFGINYRKVPARWIYCFGAPPKIAWMETATS